MGEQNQGRGNHSAIQEKIEQAHNLLETCGSSLIEDPSIHALLVKLRDSIENTYQSMLSLGVVAECKNCEEKEGGSCCGAGIENKYDAVLLLSWVAPCKIMNLTGTAVIFWEKTAVNL